MTGLKTEKRIPPSIKGTIYQHFVEAVSEEIELFRNQVREQKTSFFDVDKMSRERLIAVSETFGVPFSTLISDDIEFLRQEVKNIGFKLFYKGTPTLYKSYFLSANRIGQTFIYTYSSVSDSLIRSMKDPCDSARATEKNLPFPFYSKGDFSGKIENYLTLDSGLILDDSPAWTLDTSNSQISSNHIGLEYFIDRIIERNGLEYLMTDEYLFYLAENMEWGRRCKEVPHIGSQLSVQTDLSGLINKSYPDQEYSIPSLKLNVVARPDLMSIISSKYDIVQARFGLGKHDLASVQNPSIPFPKDLAYPIAESVVASTDTHSDTSYIGATCEYIGQEIKSFKLQEIFDGTSTHFEFTLPLAPIRKGNVCLSFKFPDDPVTWDTLDDRRGLFKSSKMYGTINYETGLCTIDTDFEYSTSQEFINSESATEKNAVWQISLEKGKTDLTRKNIRLYYNIGSGDNKKSYVAVDDGEGHFSSPSGTIVASEIDYATGRVSIRFIDSIEDESIYLTYSYHVTWYPQKGDTLLASYFFILNTISITEFGLFDNKGNMLAYATFPPLEFSSTDFHCNFTILIDTAVT